MLAADTLIGPSILWYHLSPLLVLLGGALVLLVLGALVPRWPRGLYAGFTAAVALAAMILSFILWGRISDQGGTTMVSGAVAFDRFAMLTIVVVCAAVIVASSIADDYLRREDIDGPEIYSLMLTAAIGAIVMGAANDLIVLFLGLEVLSLSLYVLAASHRRRIASQESGIKYFILGGFSSAFFLYGIALIYGGSGSTNYAKILASFSTTVQTHRTDAFVLAGIALLLVGLAFKVGAVPFHFWTPDVYQGAPTPVTAFMASAAKVAAFAAMLRVLNVALPNWRDDWRPAIWLLAIVTIVGGSMLAVVQTDVKRMLAYSSISHAGFILVGVEASGHTAGQPGVGLGVPSSMMYLFLYALIVLGTFAIITLVARTGDGQTDLSAFRGLGNSRPALAFAMTVLLLAQAGVPLTSGFIAKFGVIEAAIEVHSYAIAIVAMVGSVIAAFVYLRIMVSMWIADPEAGDEAREQVRIPLGTALAIVVCVGFTLFVGFFPGWLIDASKNATFVVQSLTP